jgi:glycosyltransferase involved in cell wall biosynthesis
MKLISVDVESGVPAIPPAELGEQWVLVRLHGRPLGVVYPDRRGCSSQELTRLIVDRHGWAIAAHLAVDGAPSAASIDDLACVPPDCPRRGLVPRAVVTVAVCTRNHASRLPECLDAIAALDYPSHLLDVLIVDNAPEDDSTRDVVARYSSFRYVREPRPGLDWARNRAILESRGEIIAYTDDDVSVDGGWARAIAAAFEEEPHAMCVTGLVVPDEIDTDAQRLFEVYGGFNRGFSRWVYRVDVDAGENAARCYGGTGRFGTGANMAFRRSFFVREGLFDPALDVGTPASGGGDLEMFFRVLRAGHALIYEPAALVRHRHRREYSALRTQLANNGIGFYAYLVRTAGAYPDQRAGVVRLALWWMWWWNVRRLLRSFVGHSDLPRDLIVAELKGAFKGLRRYQKSRRHAANVLRTFGAPGALPGPSFVEGPGATS